MSESESFDSEASYVGLPSVREAFRELGGGGVVRERSNETEAT